MAVSVFFVMKKPGLDSDSATAWTRIEIHQNAWIQFCTVFSKFRSEKMGKTGIIHDGVIKGKYKITSIVDPH
jgi:hypothetical protein